MTIAEILRAGKARLLECGWCQDEEVAMRGPPGGPCCVATAMTPFLGDNIGNVCTFFRRANGIRGNIGDWNDAPERTLEDVLAAYDRAIAAAEAQ